MSRCLEKKLTLDGNVQTFACELLSLQNGVGVLRYVIEREYNVRGVRLRPGDITHAIYWTDRPYTLYRWKLGHAGLVHYFNIADSVELTPVQFAWRDLAIDILVDADRRLQVLDENELPEGLDPKLTAYIQTAKALVLREHDRIIHEAEMLLTKILVP